MSDKSTKQLSKVLASLPEALHEVTGKLVVGMSEEALPLRTASINGHC